MAIYHTAGKGKRMAPLTFGEGGNKPAIKLPKLLAKDELFTILDAVIFQTQAFAKSRPGRLCVFWGDQIIIPSEKFNFEGKIPGRGEIEAEIFGIQKEIPKKITIWQKEWQHYGILARDRTMRFFQREKISWQDFLVFKKTMRIERLSKSLGFFSISRQFLKALMEEFKGELKKRTGKLDTDFHLWTSLTCSKKEYVQKKGDAAHWERIRKFKEKFLKKESKDCLLIRAKNLGDDTLWWDFGQLIFYYENLLKLLENSLEGEVMRKFFSVKKTNNFISIGSKLKGRIRNSVVVNSRAKDLNIEGAIIINSNVKKLIAKKVLLYNLKNLKDETLNVGEVVCGVRLKNKKPTILKTNLDRDGKKDWENKILNNPYSYQQLEKLL